uniref:Monoterpene synthase 8, chloroplastic n=1 Tax=Hedychium coronarium TaxID=71610 RepID=TPS8_HEDCO|nr:RecName: Full=Monoterpene synthase 8, chloroplastic; Short=HcTPS8; AltName: Full=Alpha-bergamotene synthase; AltName: Full=Alpha-curcumene synthase; AltName: Full=Beta-bisabolene synthase; AltName: Full=Beta-farnesene synthase; AltName: Full=Beta-sesquiphellandrene synthase; AltName: Full=Cis-alpha-bisabolene synthase; AltName: Full=Linalool synthase; Flags: Precursor [Hedychium coronarium]AGY49283.1 chloroplast terpene synthase [Hedychium coronarium]
MSLLLAPPSYFPFRGLRRSTAAKQPPCLRLVKCTADRQSPEAARRSAHYQPNMWSDDYIQSLTVESPLKVEEKEQTKKLMLLKERIAEVICEGKEVEEQLRLIDHLQQLGVAYHFKDDIKASLRNIHSSLEEISSTIIFKDGLHASALLFRLLRENGFSISEDIFEEFRDEKGQYFRSDGLKNQTDQAMLSLYEASYYEKDGEMVLQEAMECTTKHLENLLEEEGSDLKLKEQAAHALELPLNWRMERLHARWFIEACQREVMVIDNPLLLEFAKLDFNAVQSIYKKELSALSRWWTKLGVVEKLPFARDRLTENYLWTVGWAFEPEHWSFRDAQTKGNCFVTMIDDVYDVYGTLDELELFTHVVDRWDINAIDQLPDYMKILFLALFNTVNDDGYKVMKEKGLDVIPYLKRSWADLCKAYLVEAKWYHRGYKPTINEYLDNTWISISGPAIFTNAYCMANNLTKQDLERFSEYPAIAKHSSMLGRLYNDLATSTAEIERGDVPKSIQCCMHERGVSEGVAREQVKELIRGNWRCMNGDRAAASSFEEMLKTVAVDIARASQFFYHNGDKYGKADGETMTQVMSLLINPII